MVGHNNHYFIFYLFLVLCLSPRRGMQTTGTLLTKETKRDSPPTSANSRRSSNSATRCTQSSGYIWLSLTKCRNKRKEIIKQLATRRPSRPPPTLSTRLGSPPRRYDFYCGLFQRRILLQAYGDSLRLNQRDRKGQSYGSRTRPEHGKGHSQVCLFTVQDGSLRPYRVGREPRATRRQTL
jgi:hypothetical protein